jgi:hypothetical protein
VKNKYVFRIGNIKMNMIVADKNLVAKCGLYCGACRSYLKNRCKGCTQNEKATWCTIRSCCIEKEISTCAECIEYADPSKCKKYNNIISKMFGVLFNSDRNACIAQIKSIGMDGHAREMALSKKHTINKGK